MSTSEPVRITGELNIAFNYECRKCGCITRGSTHTFVVDAFMPSQVQELLELERPTAHDMPVGWSSFYGRHGNEYLCEDCILKGMKI